MIKGELNATYHEDPAGAWQASDVKKEKGNACEGHRSELRQIYCTCG